jgi:hypothetical protein
MDLGPEQSLHFPDWKYTIEKRGTKGPTRVFFIYKWVWIFYCLSDFDEVVIPAYDSIGAYSFQVGLSVRSFNVW